MEDIRIDLEICNKQTVLSVIELGQLIKRRDILVCLRTNPDKNHPDSGQLLNFDLSKNLDSLFSSN